MGDWRAEEMDWEAGQMRAMKGQEVMSLLVRDPAISQEEYYKMAEHVRRLSQPMRYDECYKAKNKKLLLL